MSTLVVFSAENATWIFHFRWFSISVDWFGKTFWMKKFVSASCIGLQKAVFYLLGLNLLSAKLRKVRLLWKMKPQKMFNMEQKIILPLYGPSSFSMRYVPQNAPLISSYWSFMDSCIGSSQYLYGVAHVVPMASSFNGWSSWPATQLVTIKWTGKWLNFPLNVKGVFGSTHHNLNAATCGFANAWVAESLRQLLWSKYL